MKKEFTMSAIEHAQMLTALTAKLTSHQPLAESERDHLAQCATCMGALIDYLDSVKPIKSSVNGSSSTNGTSASRPEAERVLSRARQVFLREFGIELGTGEAKEAART
jgi:hypothetical protein